METRTLLQSSITTSLNFYTHQLSSLSLINTKPFHFQRTHTTSLPPAKVTKPITPTLRISPSRCSLQDEQLPGVDKNVVGQDHSVALKNKAAEISSQLKGTSIFLIGINNNIKAKLGNVLADMLRYYYFDSDSLVEQAAGGEAATKSFREKDDKGFLESETEVLRQLLSMGRPVICAGDGAVKSSTNLSFMRHGISIWIDVPIVVLAKEVKESGNQPPSDDVILNSDPSKNYNVVNYDEKVVDGFYDVYGIASNSTKQGKMPLLVDLHATSISDSYDYEVILVNRLIDPALQELERTVVSLSAECRVLELGPIVSGLVQNIANLVVNTMGGPVIGDAEEILRRWTIRSYELRSSLNTIVLPLGCLDIGLSRHRALLFKVLADRISLPCRLVKGSYYTGTDEGAVNLIKVDHESEYIIDLMGAPGALIPAEIPSNHLQSSALDIMSSITIDERVKESKVENENILDLPEITNEMRDHNSSDSDLALVVGSSMPNETPSAVGPSKGDGSNLVEKNQTEKI